MTIQRIARSKKNKVPMMPNAASPDDADSSILPPVDSA
jgi:hypothetical protein